MTDDKKRLIPISIKNIEDKKWSVTIDKNEPFEVECDESQMRKLMIRLKVKNGDGEKHKRSSKNGNYLSMLDGETHYCWKSKCPKSAEEFKTLMEQKIADEVFTKAVDMNEDDSIEFIFDELSYMNDDEIIKELDDYLEDMQVGTTMSTQLPFNSIYHGELELREKLEPIDVKSFVEFVYDSIDEKINLGTVFKFDIDTMTNSICADSKIIKLWNESMICSESKFNKIFDELTKEIDKIIMSYKVR